MCDTSNIEHCTLNIEHRTFNVQCSSVEKTKGIEQTSNLAVQISNLDNKHFCLPWQTWDLLPPAIKEPPKLKIQNGDDDDLSYHRC